MDLGISFKVFPKSFNFDSGIVLIVVCFIGLCVYIFIPVRIYGNVDHLEEIITCFVFVLDKSEGGAEQAKVIVGVVVGLIIAAALVGLIYWIYIKKSR